MQAIYAAVSLTVSVSLTAWTADSARPPVEPVVEVEETVYQYEDAKNGAGPTWCVGSTCLVRVGDDVFAGGLETLKQFEPLNNVRWLLFQRGAEGWTLLRADPKDRTREPCPLACFRGGSLFMSVNPGVAIDPKQRGSAARPEILRLDPSDPKAPFQTLLPQWQGSPDFPEHSHRTLLQEHSNTAKRFPYQHGNPRLHVTPDNRLFAVYHVMANDPSNWGYGTRGPSVGGWLARRQRTTETMPGATSVCGQGTGRRTWCAAARRTQSLGRRGFAQARRAAGGRRRFETRTRLSGSAP